MARLVSEEEFNDLLKGKSRSRAAIVPDPGAGTDPMETDDDASLEEAKSIGDYYPGTTRINRGQLTDRQKLALLRDQLSSAGNDHTGEGGRQELEREISKLENKLGTSSPAAAPTRAIADAPDGIQASTEGHAAADDDPVIRRLLGLPARERKQEVAAPREAPKDEPGIVHRALRDTALDVAKGVVGLGESAVGIADLGTGGYAGKALEFIGYDPQASSKMISDLYTPQRKRANANVEAAKGFFDTAGALVTNPSALIGSIAESAPGMVGIVGAGRALATNIFMKGAKSVAGGITKDAAGKIVLSEAAEAAGKKAVADSMGKIIATGAAAEGAQGAGSIAEQARQAHREWSDYVLPSLAAGAGTAAISMATGKLGSSKLGRKLGLGDPESALATAGLTEGGERAARSTVRQAIKEGVGGAVTEGVLEEMPQSAQEQAMTNVAMGKPIGEGVPEAAAQGMMAGAGMGGPIGAFRGATRAAPEAAAAAPAQAGAAAPPAAPAAAPAAGTPPPPPPGAPATEAGTIDPATGEPVVPPKVVTKDELLDMASKQIEELAARARKEPVAGQDAQGPYVEDPAKLSANETKALNDLRVLARTRNLEALATFFGVQLAPEGAPAAPAAAPAAAGATAAPAPAATAAAAAAPAERDAQFEDLRDFATPKAREDLKAAGLNILDVTPTGPFSRITEDDVQRAKTGRERAQLRGGRAAAQGEPSAAVGEPSTANAAEYDPLLAEQGHKATAPEELPDDSSPTRIEVGGEKYDATRIGKRDYLKLQRFAKLFGKTLVLFDNQPGAGRWDDGFIHQSNPKYIFLSSVAQGAPHMVLFGHELMHAMERDMPKVFDRLKKAIIKVARPDAVEKMRKDYETLGTDREGKPVKRSDLEIEAEVWQEIVSDMGGNRLAEVETWKKIFKGLENHGMVRRVANYVRDMIGNLINFAKKQKDKGFVTDDYMKDLAAVRDAVADAAIDYIRFAQKPAKTEAVKKVVNAQAQAQPPPEADAAPPSGPTAFVAPAPLKVVPQAAPPAGKIEEAKPAEPARNKAPSRTPKEVKAKETPPAAAKRAQVEKKAAKPAEPTDAVPSDAINTINDARQAWNDLEALRMAAGDLEGIKKNPEVTKALDQIRERIKQLEAKEPAPATDELEEVEPPEEAELADELPAVFVLEDWQKANKRPAIRKATAVQIAKLPDNVRSPYKNAITDYAAAVGKGYGQALRAKAPQETLDALREEFEWAGEQIQKQFPKAQYDSFRKHLKSPDDYDLDPEYVQQPEDESEDPIDAESEAALRQKGKEKAWLKLPTEVTQTADGFRALGPSVTPDKIGIGKMFGDWKIYREINGIKKGDTVVAARPGKKTRTGTVAMVGVVSGEATSDGEPVSQIAVWFDEGLNDGDFFEVGMVTKASDKDYPSPEMVEKVDNATMHDFPKKPSSEIFPAPREAKLAEDKAKKTHGTQKVKRGTKTVEIAKFISQAEAKNLLQSWKDEAKRIGKEEDHSNDVIFSLFDYSGQWSQPWVDAGYHVIKYDVKSGDDLLRFLPMADIARLKAQGKRIIGVLAAPPCTSFTSTGNQWWPTQHDVPVKEATLTEKYGFAANKYFDTPLDYAKTLVQAVEVFVEFANPERFHVAENPVGRIRRVTGLPEPLLNMQPHHYGDPYTKNTLLWGDFNPELPTANVNPSVEAGGKGSLMHTLGSKAEAEGGERSLTPEGFAYSFFMANRAELKKPVQKAVSASRVKRSGIRQNLRAIKESPVGEHSQAEVYAKQNGFMPFTPVEEVVIPVNVPVSRSGIRRNVRTPFGLERNQDGTVTLYQSTTNVRARQAARERALRGETPRSKRILLTSRPRVGQADVLVNVDPSLLHLDREHKDGRKDFFIPIKPGEAFDRKMKKLKLFSITAPREKAISADRTIATIEEGLTKAVESISKMTPAERRANLASAREVLKSEHNVGTLLSENGKLEKTRINELGLTYNGLPVASLGLGMAAAQKLNESRLTSCPQSARCEALCLGETAGHNRVQGGKGEQRAGPRLAQYLKTEALVLHPEQFAAVLMSELDSFVRWAASPVDTEVDPKTKKHISVPKETYQPALRLNVTTDFPAKMWEALIKAYPKIMFYDYTKLVGQKSIAPNHHVTYSSNGASQVLEGKVVRAPGNNWKQMVGKLRAGFNVAMAFDSKEDIPGFVTDAASGETFQVWDGDDYDARFLDPKRPDGIGMIVGLRNKDGSGPASTSTVRHDGFFVHYDKAMGDTVTIPDQDKLERKTIAITPAVQPPAAPPARRVEYFLTEQGPRLTGERMQLRDPQLLAVQLDPRANSYQHKILMDGKHVGNITLGWRGKEIVTLPWVAMLDDNEKGRGYGEELIADLVNHNAGRDIFVQNITDDAKGFWRKMGTEFFYDGGQHGDLSKARYDQSRSARTGARPEGEGAGPVRAQAGTRAAGEAAPGTGVAGADRGEQAAGPGGEEAGPPDVNELDFTRVKRSGLRAARAAAPAAPAVKWYSELARKIQDGPNSAPAAAWKGYINGLTQKGVKPEEIQWSGILNYLDVPEIMGTGNISKEKILGFLNANGVSVQDSVHGGGGATFDASFSEWQDDEPEADYFRQEAEDLYMDQARTELLRSRNLEEGEELDEDDVREHAINMAKSNFYDDPERPQYMPITVDVNGTIYKFIANHSHGDFDLFAPANQGNELDAKGGESIWEPRSRTNPRAVPDKPQMERVIRDYLGEVLGLNFDEENVPFETYTLEGGTNYTIHKIIVPPGVTMTPDGGEGGTYLSPHFPERNILAHARTKDREDVTGKKVLFLEEIQSDWAQEGREKGFNSKDNKAQIDKVKDRIREIERAVDSFDSLRKRRQGDVDYWRGKPGGSQDLDKAVKQRDDAIFEHDRLIRERGELDRQLAKLRGANIPQAPFVKKTDAWVGLALKRMMMKAVDEGYDKVAWTTGEQQADRYRLDKSISKITLNRAFPNEPKAWTDPSVYWRLLAWDLRGNRVIQENIPLEKLPRYIGKDATNKVLEQVKRGGDAKLEGLDLRIGGEGMRTFYDQIVPKVANEQLKKLGGNTTVGNVRIQALWRIDSGRWELLNPDGVAEQTYKARWQAEKAAEKAGPGYTVRSPGNDQPGFDITPELKASMKKGVPLFSGIRKASAARAEALKAVEQAPKVKWGFEIDFDSESRRHAKTGEPNSVVEKEPATFKTMSRGTRPGREIVAREFSAFDAEGNLAGVLSVVTKGEGLGAAKIAVRDDAQRQGYGVKLLDAAEAAGVDVRPEANTYSSSGRELAKAWLGRDPAKVKRSGIRRGERISAYDELPAREEGPPRMVERLPADLISKAYYMLKEGKAEQEVIDILTDMNVRDIPAAMDKLKRSGIRTLRTKAAVSMSNSTILPGFMNGIRDLLADTVRPTEKGEFNWWHRTFGTQFHKAAQNPHFKKVFDLALKFIDEISMFAIRAEKMAPSIFPSVGQLSLKFAGGMRLKGLGLNRADNELIGRALADGTLAGVDKGPRSGKVWTDAELISKYNMTPEQRGYYREARASINQSLIDTAKALMAQIARTAKAPQSTIDSVLEQYSNQTFAQARDALVAAMPQGKKALDAETSINKIYGETVSLMAGGYWPLMRFGKYTVEVKKVDPLDPKKSDTVFFSMHESKADRERMAKAIATDPRFAGMTHVADEMNEEQHRLFAGISLDTLEAFVNAMPYSNATEEAARQTYLNMAISNRSALARMINRKGTEGYQFDATRTLASFITSNARYGSRAVNGSPLLAAAANIKGQGNVAAEATLLRDYVMNPREGAPRFRGFLFAQFLGGSIAAGLVNLTQPVLMTFPYLAQFGTRRASRAMVAGLGDTMSWLTKKSVADQGLNNALKRAADRGIIEPQEIFQLMAAARTGTKSFLGAKFMRLWGINFAVTEVFNRTITFAAAYRMGKQMPNVDPYEFAVKAVQDSQGLYNKANRPNLARETGAFGVAGTVAFTFKQYSIAYVEFLKRLYGDGVLPKPAFLLALGLLWLAAGAEGEPGSEDIDDLLETVWGWMGRPLNMKKEKRRFLRETLGLGQGATDFALSGVSSVLPLDVQGRLGMHNLVPGTAMFNPARQNEVGGEALEVLGVTGGVMKTAGEAFGKLKKGELGGAVKTILPKAVRDVVQGAEMLATGKMMDKQDRLTMAATPTDAAVRMLGFNPAKNAEEQEKIGQLHTDKTIVQSKKQEWHQRLAKAIAEGDEKTKNEIVREIQSWRERFPDYPITVNWPAVQKRAQEMKRTRAERFVKTAPKELRGEARRELLNVEE